MNKMLHNDNLRPIKANGQNLAATTGTLPHLIHGNNPDALNGNPFYLPSQSPILTSNSSVLSTSTTKQTSSTKSSSSSKDGSTCTLQSNKDSTHKNHNMLPPVSNQEIYNTFSLENSENFNYGNEKIQKDITHDDMDKSLSSDRKSNTTTTGLSLSNIYDINHMGLSGSPFPNNIKSLFPEVTGPEGAALSNLLTANMGGPPPPLHTFQAQHARGCHCKKSFCVKKYCECYFAGVYCGANCKCENCRNYQGYSLSLNTNTVAKKNTTKSNNTKKVSSSTKESTNNFSSDDTTVIKPVKTSKGKGKQQDINLTLKPFENGGMEAASLLLSTSSFRSENNDTNNLSGKTNPNERSLVNSLAQQKNAPKEKKKKKEKQNNAHHVMPSPLPTSSYCPTDPISTEMNLNLQKFVDTFAAVNKAEISKSKKTHISSSNNNSNNNKNSISGPIHQKKTLSNTQKRNNHNNNSSLKKYKTIDDDVIYPNPVNSNIEGPGGDSNMNHSIKNMSSSNSLNENQISSFGLNDMNNLNLLFNSMNQNMTNLSNMQENLMDNGQFKDFCNGNLPPI